MFNSGWRNKISHAEEQLCCLAPTTEPLRSGAREPQLEKPLCAATRESPHVSMKTLAGKKKKKFLNIELAKTFVRIFPITSYGKPNKYFGQPSICSHMLNF